MDLNALLRSEADRVETELTRRLDGLDPAFAPRLGRAMRYSLLGGGKRLRPVLCLWIHDTLRPGRGNAVWAAACALEMVHSYSLIHDDLPAMDDDDVRRGQPSCHRRFDEATAILAGDTLQTEAFRMLARVQPAQIAVELVRRLADASGLAGMAAGQQLDLEAEADPASVDQMRTIHRLKTGRLIGAAVALGAVCGGLDPASVDRAAAAGEDLGLAFQIVDDLLDARTEGEALGKTAGKDADQGKLTALATLGAESAGREAETLLVQGQSVLRELGLLQPRVEALTARLVRRDR